MTFLPISLKRALSMALPLLALLGPVLGIQEKAKLPDFDMRQHDAVPVALADTQREAAVARLRTLVPDVQIDWHEVIGSPKWIRARSGFLSGPDGQGNAIPAVRAQAFPANDPYRPVEAFLDEHAALFGHDATVLNSAKVERDYVTAHDGLRTVVWHQHLDNIPIFEGLLSAHITKSGELVSLSSQMLPDVAKAADSAYSNRKQFEIQPRVTAAQAVVIAAANIEDTIAAHAVSELPRQPGDPTTRHRFKAELALNGETVVNLTWLPMDRSVMRLCWDVTVTSRRLGEMFSLLVDAETGEVLLRHSLTSDISNATYRVFTSDSPSPFSPGWPTPNSGQPAITTRSLITLSALDTNASPNGWINDGGNDTQGNNVDAHTDLNGDNVADTPRPQGSPNRVFDFPLDLTQAPSSYRNAAVTQLFYWCNWMHDSLYGLGFTEAAGNFQTNNFSRGGQGNDAVQADAQDSGGLTAVESGSGQNRNNANFSTGGADGSGARMRMYIWDGPTPNRDGDLDAEIVLHEYTHGLSIRLVGGGTGISALQPSGMGEGWSDFYSLSLLSASGDNVNGNYALGAYATSQFSGLTQNYYYGIRRYPYSTNLTKNPLTFRDIDPAQISPHTGVPISPAIGGAANEVHNMGEVWCVTLWEARANMLALYGASGNRNMLQLVTDGMRLAPPNPTFLQARDAIILADRTNNNGTNYVQLWTAFAKRGMGESATSPASSTTAGVSEAFDAVIHVDESSLNSSSDGSTSRPFHSVTAAYIVHLPSNIIRIRSGNYPDTGTFTNVVLQSENGPVTIGMP